MAEILIREEQADLSANSRVTQVMVFFDKARVTRKQVREVGKGENVVTFTNLAHDLDESSLRAAITRGQASIVSTTLVTNQLYFFKAAEDEAKYKEVLESFRQLIVLQDESTACALENFIIQDLRAYIQEALNEILLEQEVSLPRLKSSLALLEKKLEENSGRLLQLDTETSLLKRKLALLKKELARIRRLDKRLQNNIELTLVAEQEGTLELEVAYLVPGVSWRSCYDAKLDPATGAVRLTCYGELRQETGADWQDAALSFSTAETRESVEIPELHPLGVSGYEEKRDKTLVVEREEGRADEAEGETSKPGEPEPAGPAPAVEAVKQGTAYLFKVAGPATVPADGHWHRVPVLEQTLTARTTYETVPEIMEHVYLKGTLVNTTGLPLLPGDVSIYRKESYLGKAQLAYVAPAAEFALSFGIDDDLRVKRIPFYPVEEQRTPLGKNQRRWSYKFILYNYKSSARQVLLREAVHDSRIVEVEVEILKTTTSGFSRNDDGVLSWQLELPPEPFAYTTVLLDYCVRAPKSFDLNTI